MARPARQLRARADPRDGSLAVFADRTAAEAFAAEDRFVLEGVVSKHTGKEWREILL